MNIKNNPLVFLGVPVSNLTADEVVDRILELIEYYKTDLQPRYVATLNADFLTHTNNWNYQGVRYPELLHILRQASLVTIDGMPILWACRAMGSCVKERVTGVDLVPKLAEKCSDKNASIFLLGGSEKSLKLCSLYLQVLYPNLKIAGSAHAKIDVQGKALLDEETRDALLIEQINRSKADLLFINLGNPKQEIWYERVREKLHVPVSIGVGGSFDLLTGVVSRAPLWMQKFGLEWFYRLLQEPKRLWKRYMLDIFKFSYMVIPLLFFQNTSRILYELFYQSKNEVLSLDQPLLFISTHNTIALLQLPKRLNEKVSLEIKGCLDDFFSQDALIFDFKNVRHLDLEGVRLLLHISQRALIKEKKQFFMINISKDVKFMCKLHRVWDAISENYCPRPKDILAHLSQYGKSAEFYHAVQQETHQVRLSFFGRLDHGNNYDDIIKKIKPIIHQKECVLDLSYCTYIDNTGFQFLLKLKNLQSGYYISLRIVGISKSLKKQFKITKVYDFLLTNL